ncbi:MULTISPECIES: phage major capsid protein [Eubacteriales]|jgi:HK97 family phage major capsid protein|uniref:phage major capsid protein n=1 Tax=Eubacteriales TaxID=186802 RepID=UPI002070BC59|nr:MAG TPA: major capsid protein [Caudoviricetes sp.]
MALKTIMLRRSIEKKQAELEALRQKDAEFSTREAELEAAINEAETSEQEQAVTEEVETFDADKTAHEAKKAALAGEIEGLEAELSEAEAAAPTKSKENHLTKERTERKMETNINIRALPMSRRAFDALPMEQRSEIVAREDVREFFVQLRSMKGQQRGVSGAELTIPVVFLDMIAENMYRYSKLLNRVRIRNVNGEARQTIAGTVPEAVWTEMCGAINELTFVFNQVTLDGFKVSGYVPVCNSILEDNDINLASWIVEMLSESIGLALDKAILYGKGAASKMPLGIVTRLAQTSKPSDYPANAPEWVDLHTSNILKVDSTAEPITFWSALAVAAGNTFTRYSRGRQFWAMNSKTYAKLRAKLIAFNYEGGLVAQFPGTMPVIDGDIDVLEFIPDGDIIGGYGDLYLLALRAGMTIESSREVQFIQDNTVFKGKERADGMPVIPGAFVAININNAAVTTVMDFAADTANDARLTALAVGTETLSPVFATGTYSYTLAPTGTSAKIEATSSQPGAKVAISYNGQNVRNGGEVTWLTDGAAHPLTVTVTQGNAVRVYTVSVTK